MYILRRRHDPVIILRSKTFDIDNGSGTTDDDVLAVLDVPFVILSARAVYVEASDTAGVEGATIAIGTTVGGVDIVAAVALEISKAVGAKTELTVLAAQKDQPANQAIFARHTGIASTEAGQYFVEVEVGLI